MSDRANPTDPPRGDDATSTPAASPDPDERDHPPAPPPPSAVSSAEAVSAEPVPAARTPGYRELALGSAGALLLVVVLVATAPFWAALLPWGAAVSDRTEVMQLQRQVAELQARPLAATDAGATRQQIAQLTAGLTDLRARVEQAAGAPSSSAASPRVEALEQALRAQAAVTAELAAKVDGLAKAGPARAARQEADVGMVLALLQLRNAVRDGRPFVPEYDALAALAKGAGPELIAAAAPLAEPARTGVPGRAVLERRLRELTPAIAAAPTATSAATPAPGAGEAEPSWGDAVLARLGKLVTIRRIDGAGASGTAPTSRPAAVVAAAERALAGGDIAGAIAALEQLQGPPAEAAAPWLRMARERLAFDAALRHIEALLTARLGAAPEPGSRG